MRVYHLSHFRTRTPGIPVIFLIFIRRIFQNHVFIHVDNRHDFANVLGHPNGN
jgi:hypothetical protein